MAITGLILAGGRGQRMGGVDKGLQPLRGEPMVAHALRRLQPQVDRVAINANQNLDSYRGFGVPLWPDTIPGFAGPLAGLHTGLAHCETEFLATVPCDSPFLPADLVARLHRALIEQQAQAAFALTVDAGRRQPHPVFSLLRATLLPGLARYLEQGGRKMTDWFASLPAVAVQFDDEQAFDNINTAEELRQLNRND